MTALDHRCGQLVRIDAARETAVVVRRRIPLGMPVGEGGFEESSLRDLLFRFFDTLAVAAIDAAHPNPVPVCRELSTPAGFVDATYANSPGHVILAEVKS